MLKLLAGVFLELIIGASLGGALMAIVVPVLHHTGVLQGQLEPAPVVATVLGGAVVAVLIRPGSAIRRYRRR